MDDEFQDNFVKYMADVFADILNGNIFVEDIFDEHLAAFLSNLSNELVNACDSPKIVIQITKYIDDYFDDVSFIYGLTTLVVRMATRGVANFMPFALFGVAHLFSAIFLQFYWAGYSLGQIARIFFYEEI